MRAFFDWLFGVLGYVRKPQPQDGGPSDPHPPI